MKEFNKIPQLIKALDEAGAEKALTKSAIAVQASAVMRVPAPTGNLRSSITYKVTGKEGRVGTNTDYAPYVEFGTGVYAEGGGGRQTPWVYKHPKYGFIWTKGNQARPFLRPAIDENRGRILDIMKAAYNDAIKGVV